MESAIEKQLTEAGYRMLGIEDKRDDLILSILESGDMRYLKAIPFLIYRYPINLEKIYSRTSKKKLLAQIIGITGRIFFDKGINKQLPSIFEPSSFDYDEFEQEFEIQMANLEKPELLIEKQKIYAERDLQMWLSQLFTKKEKQTIRRILENKPVTKTDYEYYSRKTKKKLNGIINLQDFARTLYHKSPKIDEDLFYLRKLLEEKYGPIKSIYQQSSYLLITPINNEKRENDSSRIIAIELKSIKNPEILSLLEKYDGERQDFT